MATLKQGADFAVRVGVPSITTHAGFIPENLTDPLYPPLITALREAGTAAVRSALGLQLETGQETPVVLLQVFEDVGLDNLGVNLDPANLLMYGKANPVDTLDLLGKFRSQRALKDGEYPT